MLEMMGENPQLDAAAIETVGTKDWDGFAVAVVKKETGTPTLRSTSSSCTIVKTSPLRCRPRVPPTPGSV